MCQTAIPHRQKAQKQKLRIIKKKQKPGKREETATTSAVAPGPSLRSSHLPKTKKRKKNEEKQTPQTTVASASSDGFFGGWGGLVFLFFLFFFGIRIVGLTAFAFKQKKLRRRRPISLENAIAVGSK